MSAEYLLNHEECGVIDEYSVVEAAVDPNDEAVRVEVSSQSLTRASRNQS